MRRGALSWFSVASLDLPDRLLLFAVVLLPWAFGGIEIWAHRLAGFVIVAAATVRVGFGSGQDWPLRSVRLLLIPATLILGLAAFQLLPLPPSAVAALSPKAHELYAATFPGYGGETEEDPVAGLEAVALDQVPEVAGLALPRAAAQPVFEELGGRWKGWRPLSLAPSFTLERVFWYVPLLIAFLMFNRAARDGERRRVFQAVLFLDFLALALFGLVFAAIGNDKLYWIRPTVQEANPFGPYVNPANFGAVMELAVPWVSAAAWSAWRLKRHAVLPFPILAATAGCCVLAGLLCGSRATVVLMVVGLAGVALVVQRHSGARRLLAIASAGVLLVVSLLLAFSGLGARLARALDFEGAGGFTDIERVAGWRAAWTMLGDFGLTGAGIGAFQDVFPIYAPAGGDARMKHLHNDYFEIAVEAGWIGAVLVAWMIVAFARLAWRGSERRLTAGGLLIGVVCLFLHATVDFNHQIPANALLFVAAAGIVTAREDRE